MGMEPCPATVAAVVDVVVELLLLLRMLLL
jgi:hypothetical protein